MSKSVQVGVGRGCAPLAGAVAAHMSPARGGARGRRHGRSINSPHEAGSPLFSVPSRTPRATQHSWHDGRAGNTPLMFLREPQSSAPEETTMATRISAPVVKERTGVLTAARYSEAAHLSWAELNLHSALWTVPAERMKARCVHRVPLSRQALAVLDRARSLARSDSAVFVRRGPGVRLVSNHAANRLLRDLELRRRRRHARDRLRTPAHRSNSEQAARRPSQACARPRPPALRDAFEAVGRPPNRRPGAPPQRATDPGAAPLGAGATPTARARATPAAREPTRRSTRRSARARRPPSRPRP